MSGHAAISKARRDGLLEKAKSVLARGWCKIHQAENSEGKPTGISASDAVSFCVYGAVGFVCPDADTARQVREYLQDVLEWRTGWREVANWANDPRRTHEQILELFDAAKSYRMRQAS